MSFTDGMRAQFTMNKGMVSFESDHDTETRLFVGTLIRYP